MLLAILFSHNWKIKKLMVPSISKAETINVMHPIKKALIFLFLIKIRPIIGAIIINSIDNIEEKNVMYSFKLPQIYDNY